MLAACDRRDCAGEHRRAGTEIEQPQWAGSCRQREHEVPWRDDAGISKDLDEATRKSDPHVGVPGSVVDGPLRIIGRISVAARVAMVVEAQAWAVTPKG